MDENKLTDDEIAFTDRVMIEFAVASNDRETRSLHSMVADRALALAIELLKRRRHLHLKVIDETHQP